MSVYMIHCRKNTYCTLYFYCYRKLYTYMNAEENQIKIKSNQMCNIFNLPCILPINIAGEWSKNESIIG